VVFFERRFPDALGNGAVMTASGFGVVTVLPVAVVVVVLMACLMCSSWSFDVVEGVLVVVNGAWYHALVNVLEVVAEALVRVAALAGVGQVDAAAVHALLDVAGVVLGALGAALDGERAHVLVLRALRHEKGGPRRRHRV